MRNSLKLFLAGAVLLLACSLPSAAAGKTINLSSPDGHLKVTVVADGGLSYSVLYDDEVLILPSRVGITPVGAAEFGSLRPGRVTRRSVDETFDAIAYKRARVRDNFNEAALSFKDCDFIVRAYDDCIAWRFVSKSKVPFKVASEREEFNFPGNWNTYVAGVGSFFSSHESRYDHLALSEVSGERLGLLPLMVEVPDGKKIDIMEASLFNYPGMYLQGTGGNSLKGTWAPLPKDVEQGGHNMLQGIVKSRHDYLAECSAGEAFPWRIVAVVDEDIKLTDNDIVYRLADAPAPGSDWSWLRPGKVAWDWWNDWNITGVDFKSGVNTPTYKAYIDFASENGIEYVILDEGWSVNRAADLMQIVPEIDLPGIISYAASKNVGIILWAGYWAFNRDMENVCAHYSRMGVKGFKIDFMDRDDQAMVDFYTRAAETCARYRLVADFHGAFKPVGLNRRFPNVLNYEGVFGLENMKWVDPDVDQPLYDVCIPYLRMAAGPMDYTQGAMKNAARGLYYPLGSSPMSMGTRCHQLGEYMIFDSPLCMLCDSPSNYRKESECTGFIAKVPTVWDETLPLDGRVGEYIVMARKKGDAWYVGGITNWDERDVVVDLSFLGEGDWEAELFRDGVNADRDGTDYRREVLRLDDGRSLSLHMAPAGGFALVLRRR